MSPVQAAEFRVQAAEFRVQAAEFRVQAAEFRVQWGEFRVRVGGEMYNDLYGPGRPGYVLHREVPPRRPGRGNGDQSRTGGAPSLPSWCGAATDG
ncbi:hypothetical protein Atai01_75790 [Amycolatopsis taiwanensis]|uniref:Uncharacterized protein n=1 Tax=Amycolatopsis taiwanensis TaxID=342230 RepID=A0A9W6RBK5_9PSEU|nr:hypothetical protein Atai01_75790 [Amycolatopsis taiwanensis]